MFLRISKFFHSATAISLYVPRKRLTPIRSKSAGSFLIRSQLCQEAYKHSTRQALVHLYQHGIQCLFGQLFRTDLQIWFFLLEKVFAAVPSDSSVLFSVKELFDVFEPAVLAKGHTMGLLPESSRWHCLTGVDA